MNITDELADEILKLADGVETLLNGKLTHEAVLVLLCHKTKLSQRTVKAVLTAIPKLKSYVKSGARKNENNKINKQGVKAGRNR